MQLSGTPHRLIQMVSDLIDGIGQPTLKDFLLFQWHLRILIIQIVSEREFSDKFSIIFCEITILSHLNLSLYRYIWISFAEF